MDFEADVANLKEIDHILMLIYLYTTLFVMIQSWIQINFATLVCKPNKIQEIEAQFSMVAKYSGF